MTFDKWFNKQSVLIKAILLLLPVVGWACDRARIDSYVLCDGSRAASIVCDCHSVSACVRDGDVGAWVAIRPQETYTARGCECHVTAVAEVYGA